MKAKDFVKKYGWGNARLYLNAASNEAVWISFDMLDYGVETVVLRVADLKSLVESYDLVEDLGGLKTSLYLRNHNMLMKEHLPRIKKAIADVESCL